MSKVIAYAYDADIHCVNCTHKRFDGFMYYACGQWYMHGAAKDSEGNPVHPVFDTEENPDGLYCGDCRETITPRWEGGKDNAESC